MNAAGAAELEDRVLNRFRREREGVLSKLRVAGAK